LTSFAYHENNRPCKISLWERPLNESDPDYASKRRQRAITRPYLSSHIFHPLWPYPDLEDSNFIPDWPPASEFFALSRHCKELQEQKVPPSMVWTIGMWVYWTPHDRSNLKTYAEMEDIDSSCFVCHMVLLQEVCPVAHLVETAMRTFGDKDLDTHRKSGIPQYWQVTDFMRRFVSRVCRSSFPIARLH
jgi:hypothetical protein